MGREAGGRVSGEGRAEGKWGGRRASGEGAVGWGGRWAGGRVSGE